MSIKSFYTITAPTTWATPPAVYSFSSLAQIENCPTAWQLQNSWYDGLERYPSRPVPAATEGEIIHTVLEKFFRELARHGMPAIGSDPFQKTVKRLATIDLIAQLVADHQVKLANHPRGSGFHIKSSVQELHNKFIRIFKEQYCKVRSVTASSMVGLFDRTFPEIATNIEVTQDYTALLERHGVLTELSLRHPVVPFKGILDFVWLDDTGIVISDFKSGTVKAEHREQLLLYAFLWEANTKQVPRRAYIVYPDSSVTIEITEELLSTVSDEITERIEKAGSSLQMTPGKANVSKLCQYCHVRQMCDSYWKSLETRKGSTIQCGDIEIAVSEIHGDFGLIGSSADGSVVNLVYDKDAAKIFGHFIVGERLRIIGAMSKSDAYELKPWSEVFHAGRTVIV